MKALLQACLSGQVPASPEKRFLISWEPGGEKLDWTWPKGRLQLALPRFRIHGCLAVREG